MRDELETIELRAIQVFAQQSLSAGLRDIDVDRRIDLVRGQLVYAINAFVYGQEGPSVTASETVLEARLPRWLPRWLRRRWSQERTLTVDAQGAVIYPDMLVDTPKLGRGVRIVRYVWKDFQ